MPLRRSTHPLLTKPDRFHAAGTFCCAGYCCLGAAGGLAAGAVISPGVAFFVLVLVFDFVFFFGVLGSAAEG